jgi:hypothetical protein
MAMRQRDNSLGSGVYYAADDYVGIGRRLVIYLVDGVVLSALLIGTLILWVLIGGGPPRGLFAGHFGNPVGLRRGVQTLATAHGRLLAQRLPAR